MHCTLRVLRFFHFFKGIGYHALFRLICRFSSLCVLLQLSSALFKGTPDELGDERLGPTVLVDVCPNLPTRRRVVPKSASCASWLFPSSKMMAHQFCHSYQLLSNLRLPVCLRRCRCACVSLAFIVLSCVASHVGQPAVCPNCVQRQDVELPAFAVFHCMCPRHRQFHFKHCPFDNYRFCQVYSFSLFWVWFSTVILIHVFWQNVVGVLRHIPSH